MKAQRVGLSLIKWTCIDCDKVFYGDSADPGAKRCPECRVKKYRADDKKLLLKLASKGL